MATTDILGVCCSCIRIISQREFPLLTTSIKLWIKLNKHFFSLKQDIFLGFTNVSPSTSSYFKTLSLDIFSEVEKNYQTFKSFGDIIITGDFNARTKTDDDYIIDEEDRFSPITDLDHYVIDSVPITRSNTDLNPTDSHGERLFELCKSNLPRLLNGRFGNNSDRHTRYPTELGDKPSVIDYTLTSKNLLSLIKSFNMEPFTILSDHCCLNTKIMCSNKYSAEVEHEQIKLNKVPNKFIIDKTSLSIFQTALRSEMNTKTINNYSTAIFLEDQEGIDEALEQLTDLIMNTARRIFKQKKTLNCRKKKPNNVKHKKWYSSECKTLRSMLKVAKQNFERNPMDHTLVNKFLYCKKKCKKCLKKLKTNILKILQIHF